MTHIEAPWNQTRIGLPIDAPANTVIQKDWMKDYYGSRAQEED